MKSVDALPIATPPRSSLERRTLSAQLEDIIRTDILTGRLLPGDRLRASDITLRYGVSATPLREALNRLAAEGWLEVTAQSSARVCPASVSELRDIYALRLNLEPEALREAIKHGDAGWERRLEAAGERLHELTLRGDYHNAVVEWSDAHDDFQEALFSGCPSVWLMRFLNLIYAHSQRYRWLALVQRGANTSVSPTVLAREHDDICHAALRRDTLGAVRALKQHLQATVVSGEREFLQLEGVSG